MSDRFGRRFGCRFGKAETDAAVPGCVQKTLCKWRFVMRAHGKGVSVSARCFTLNQAQVNEIACAAGHAGRKQGSGERLVFGHDGIAHFHGANLG
ncbi:MAG: hypothetical protein RLO21_18540, partial [Nitratireductor sp.]